MSDRLEQFLKSADRANEESPRDSLAGVAARVRERHARRRAARQISTALVIVLVATSLFVVYHPSPPTTVAIAPPVPKLKLSLQEQIELHEQTIARLAPPTHASVPYDDPMSELRIQRDRAALVLVYEADAHLKADRRDAALALYRQAIELFPNTHWAEVARERTRQIQM